MQQHILGVIGNIICCFAGNLMDTALKEFWQEAQLLQGGLVTAAWVSFGQNVTESGYSAPNLIGLSYNTDVFSLIIHYWKAYTGLPIHIN